MNDFNLSIAKWYRQNKRDLPWRNSIDPYLIWLSEIILQQTRVDQGKSYFEKFARKYPTVGDLANATENEILNDWQGLGYYSRARNMHASAKIIRDEYAGFFPSNYSEILKLKGVGSYTAAAIASISFNQKKAVVDGNVYRVLSRVFDISTPIDNAIGKKEFQMLADELIVDKNPGEHNQALMELGALICTPKQPKCSSCPLESMCEGTQKNKFLDLPKKEKKTKVRDRFLHFLIYNDGDKVLLEKRESKDVWQNLFQFPCIEILKGEKTINAFNNQVRESLQITHQLSHQKIHAVFHHFNILPKQIDKKWIPVRKNEIQNYPLPRLIDRYLEENEL